MSEIFQRNQSPQSNIEAKEGDRKREEKKLIDVEFKRKLKSPDW